MKQPELLWITQGIGEGKGNPSQYSCLESSMDTGVWWATVHGVTWVRRDLVTKPPFKEYTHLITQLELWMQLFLEIAGKTLFIWEMEMIKVEF